MRRDGPRPINLREYEPLAEVCLPPQAWSFVSGGAGDEETLRDNEAAFRRWRLRPRHLVDLVEVDTRTAVLGQTVAAPVLLAPIGLVSTFHSDAERLCARAAQAAGTVLCVSTFADLSAGAIRAAAPEALLWQQVYAQRERAQTADVVQQAAAAGYGALMLTIDTPRLGRRERDLRTGHVLPVEQLAPRFTWDDLGWLRSLSPLPLVLKGVLTAEDAQLAVEHGAAGVVVSNHGGRQLDRAVASLDALPEVIEAVGGRAEVYLDGGVRRGVDVLTALALGARAVLVGRPAVWALAVGGQAGVEHVLALLREELALALHLSGRRSVAEVDRTLVRPAPPA